MNTLTRLTCLSVLLTATSCAQHHLWGPPEVDNALLAHIPDHQREQIVEARAARAEFEERAVFAESELARARAERRLARESANVADAELRRAEERVEYAETLDDGEYDDARTELAATRQKCRIERARIAEHDQRVEAAEARFELRGHELKLAGARVELRKALAVKQVDRPEAEHVNVQRFEERVRELERRVADAEIDLEAEERKIAERVRYVETLIDQEVAQS